MPEKEPIVFKAEVHIGLDEKGAVHVTTTGKREDISLALLLALSSNQTLRDLTLLTVRNGFKLIGEINSDLWQKEKEQ